MTLLQTTSFKITTHTDRLPSSRWCILAAFGTAVEHRRFRCLRKLGVRVRAFQVHQFVLSLLYFSIPLINSLFLYEILCCLSTQLLRLTTSGTLQRSCIFKSKSTCLSMFYLVIKSAWEILVSALSRVWFSCEARAFNCDNYCFFDSIKFFFLLNI